MGCSPGGGFVVRLQDGVVGGFPKAGVITPAWGKILNNKELLNCLFSFLF